ncbi:transposase [Nocardia sp. NBC_01329]|nr:transposase [Nocardia sp. NBC_01329]
MATNAVIAWTTMYYGIAVEQMRRAGQRIDDEVLAHISPAHSAYITPGAGAEGARHPLLASPRCPE